MKNRKLMVVLVGVAFLTEVTWAQDREVFTLTPQDVVTRAGVKLKSDGSGLLDCVLTKEKASEFADVTKRNLNKMLRIVINDKVASELLVKEEVTGGVFTVQVKNADQAVAFASYLNTYHTGAPPRASKMLATIAADPKFESDYFRTWSYSQLDKLDQWQDVAAQAQDWKTNGFLVLVSRGVTPLFVEKKLGKPQQVTEDEVPGLLVDGKPTKGKCFWYESVGLMFWQDALYLIAYKPKPKVPNK